MLTVTPEGREGIYLVESDELIAWLHGYPETEIHNFLPGGNIMMGADWSKDAVIEEIKKSEMRAILTGESKRNNLNHALAVITENELKLFDIGDVENQLVIQEP